MASLGKQYNGSNLKKSRKLIYEEKEKIEQIISIPHKPLNQESKNVPKSICDFSFKDELGEGTFGHVRLAINKQTGEKVAIKILEKKKILEFEDKIRVEREIKILKCLRHPNIVHLYSVVQTMDNLYIIMEYARGIELFDFIAKRKRIDEITACQIYQQIISGLEYLHKNNIVHRDIKPENLIINKKTKELKIVDFGLSNMFNTEKRLLSSSCGSPSYAAPEMLQGHKYRPQPVDVWSSGIVLYAMICGYLPFEDENNDLLYRKICIGKFSIPEHVSSNCKDLLKKILVTDPIKRITIKQIKNHPWFKLYNIKGKLILYEGLFIDKYIIPLDEDIIDKMSRQMNMEGDIIRLSVLNNKHNDISTLYYLFLLKKVNSNLKSVADLKSDLFREYTKNKNNIFNNENDHFNNSSKLIQSGKEIRKNDYNKKSSNFFNHINEENKKLYSHKKRPVSYGEFNYKNTLNMSNTTRAKKIIDVNNINNYPSQMTDRYNLKQILKPKNIFENKNTDINEEQEYRQKSERRKVSKKEYNTINKDTKDNKDNKKKMKQYNPKDNNEKLEKILSSLKNEIKNKYLGKKDDNSTNDIKLKKCQKDNIKEEEYETNNNNVDNYVEKDIKEEEDFDNKNFNYHNYERDDIKEEEYETEKNKKIDNFEKKEKEKSSSNLRKKLKNSYFNHLLSNRKKIFNTIDWDDNYQELRENNKRFNKNANISSKFQNKLIDKNNIETIEEKNNIPNLSFNLKKLTNSNFNTELLNKNLNTEYSLLNDTSPISNIKKKSKNNISIIKPRKNIYSNSNVVKSKYKHKKSVKHYNNKYINSVSNSKSPVKMNKSCVDINNNNENEKQNSNMYKSQNNKFQTENKNYLNIIYEKENKSSNTNNRKNETSNKQKLYQKLKKDKKSVSSTFNDYKNNLETISKNSYDKLRLNLHLYSSFNNKNEEINKRIYSSNRNTEENYYESIKTIHTINEENNQNEVTFEPFPLSNIYISNRHTLKHEIDNILDDYKIKYKNNGFSYLINNDKNEMISIKIKTYYNPSFNIVQIYKKGNEKYVFFDFINKFLSKIKSI